MTFLKTSALSFYRPQNALGWSKLFVPDQKFIYILWQSQTFCARQKDDLHSVKLFFWAGTKVFEEVLNAVKFLGWLKNFGQAQYILGPEKGEGITYLLELCCNLLLQQHRFCPHS